MDQIKYRIENLELRLLSKAKMSLSLFSEIVLWRKKQDENTEDEYCFTIASFKYGSDGYPELVYCGARPLTALSEEEKKYFQILIEEGYKYKWDDEGKLERI